MTTFETLKTNFPVNWMTVLVGWEGLGMISPWPYDWEKSPPLLTLDEMYKHCYDAVGKTDDKEELRLMIDVLEFENKSPNRALVRSLIQPLARLHSNDATFELRKWRAIILGEVLGKLQNDGLNDWISIAEFWMYFGFPPDSPIEFQTFEKNKRSEEMYTDDNMNQLVVAHKAWLQREVQEIQKP